ncbi:hypothetical protein [Arthrobacter russicus]|uniref:Uncharacterized protein n=1 Tax=Arthrobacter russicus TaxID=172040 RepID=A0ABU1J8L5_9MICC|nr:hypothetical protein [Arthrobacter russicus]MDR6268758.1 hypothetical protein [Arthrobacter russicus]
MHHTGGPGWRITMDTSGPLLIALYLRDASGLAGAGTPALSAAEPAIKAVDPRQLTHAVGGPDVLRFEWEQWWSQLLGTFPGKPPELVPPDFPGFDGNPALQRVLQAHFGSALTWARERISDYELFAARRETLGETKILARLVQDRELELGRNSRDFTLSILELPLAEPRAWFLEPDRMVMSQSLLSSPETFASYVQPVVEMLA